MTTLIHGTTPLLATETPLPRRAQNAIWHSGSGTPLGLFCDYNAAPVELQDFAPVLLFSQLGYSEPAPLILDRKGAAMQAMISLLKLTEVTFHPTAIEVTSEETGEKYRIGIAQAYASLQDFNGLDEAVGRTRDFLELGLSEAEDPDVASSNVRLVQVAPAEDFEALREALTASLLADMPGLRDASGLPLADIGWSLDFADDKYSAKTAFGPMPARQLAEIMGKPDREDLYPPNLVYLSVDGTLAQEAGSDADLDSLELWTRCLDRTQGLADRLGKWIGGRISDISGS